MEQAAHLKTEIARHLDGELEVVAGAGFENLRFGGVLAAGFSDRPPGCDQACT